jgi:hypothetical protein
MGPLDALRRTEQQIQEAARRGADLARSTLQGVETRMRRRMHRKSQSQRLPMSAHPGANQESQGTSATAARTGIVSVNGQDVEKMRCTGGRKVA